jgi:hypothetical protein
MVSNLVTGLHPLSQKQGTIDSSKPGEKPQMVSNLVSEIIKFDVVNEKNTPINIVNRSYFSKLFSM